MRKRSNYSINRIIRLNPIKSKSIRSYSKFRSLVHDSGLFDEKFYRNSYHDNVPSDIDAIDHYIEAGAARGFLPNPWFDSQLYLANNPDVKDAGLNPLLHFAQHGWKELRAPSPQYDLVWHWLVDNKGDFGAPNPMVRHCAQYAIAPEEVVVRATGLLSADEKIIFSDACRSALSEHDLPEGALYRIADYAAQNELWTTAEGALHALLLKRPDHLDCRQSLVDILERQGRIWQAISVLENAVAQGVTSAELLFRLGEMEEKRKRYREAAWAFGKAVALKGDDAYWHYRHGYALEQAGESALAKRAYDAAMRGDDKHDIARFGVGILHQNRGLWKEAASAYAATAAQQPSDADLWFKLGFAHDRCYQWEQAQRAYLVGLSLELTRPYWHYRLGLVLERQEKWREAAAAYRTGADMDAEHRSYWYYRCGYVLEKAEAYVEACAAYLLTDKAFWRVFKAKGPTAYSEWFPYDRAGARDQTTATAGVGTAFMEALADMACDHLETVSNASGHASDRAYVLARKLEARGQLESAAEVYQRALALSPRHMPAWYEGLGKALTKLGRYSEASEAFRNSRIFKRPFGVDISKYESDRKNGMFMEYREYSETMPIAERTVFYETFLGSNVGCNPYAIFRYIVDRPEFSGWRHIWVVNDKKEIPEEYAERDNVIFIPRGCDAYYRYLATSEYLINNVTFPYWFSRRDGQKYLNTWHGTPLKGLGKDMKDEFMVHGNVTRNFLHATHLLSPNVHTSDVMMNGYDIAGIYAGKFAETGYPRIDHLINADSGRKARLFRELGLNPEKPVVLYAPTWRGVQGKPEVDRNRIVFDVSAMIGEGYQLVFRGHHFMESALAELDIPVSLAPQRIDTCDLLSIVDVLVTDYSSILFDFIPSGRPIIYYAYDLEDYARGRGFYFDMSELPGALCKEMSEVRAAIAQGLGKSVKDDAAYRQAMARFCPFEDGNSTRRAVEFLFFGSEERVVNRYDDTRKSIIMYNGMFPANGITASFLNLLRSLKTEDLQISVLVDPARIKIDPVRVQKFEAMPDYINCLAQTGSPVMTPEELWIVNRYNTRNSLESGEMWDILWRAYRCEYRRLFGDMKHDAFVNFEGYNAAVAAIGAAAPEHVRKTIYLHNDMIGERDMKLPYLDRVFGTYSRYDHLISVSKTMNKVNFEKISPEFHLNGGRFTSCDNTVDIDSIVSMAQERLDEDLRPWFGGGRTFVCLGRMSPEKDHAKLIQAFSGVLRQYPEAKLVILGDGPLRQDLRRLVNDLGIDRSVKFAGLRMNPFPALKAGDCFVLSSNHEGQPMVLLEAMVLAKPIVATDIDGNRGLLGEDYGQLVENSAEGLRRGMLAFLDGRLRHYTFHAADYQKNAVSTFRNIISA